ENITEETSAPEITSAPRITEETSAPEITSAPRITEETSAPEITSAPRITEETSAPEITSITSAPRITEETSAPEITSAPRITEETSAPEITSAPRITEETSAPEITSAPRITEETSAPEITSAPRITEETSAPEITSAPRITEETSAPEITSAPRITEETSAPEMTEVTSTAQTTEENITAQKTEVTAPQTTEENITPQISEDKTEENITPEKTEITSAPEMTEDSLTTQIAEISSTWQITEETSRPEPAEDRFTPAAGDEPPEAAAAAPPETPSSCSEPQPREEKSRSDPADRYDSPPIASRASASLAMDPLGHKDSAAFDPDVLSQSNDDFMFEMKKSPFQSFPPVSDGLEEATAARRSVEVSESPSPDLVQDLKPETDADAPVSLSYAPSDLYSNITTASDDRPTSLPDILKSSPMNPEKLDSGSSEGSPDFSPVHRSVDDSPNSPFPANNTFAFDTKNLLLKEMAEETEARAVERAKTEVENNSKQSFTAFDLVKETDVPLKSDDLLKDKEVMRQSEVQMADRFECLGFPGEPSDSESPSADSFSPVLDAVTQEPSEQERRAIQGAMDTAEEASEARIHDVKSGRLD
uniref:Uncharacterized protein n=1 Tax=Cyprinus carpio TaxID=7962 RepID=A0A8C2HU58_CYPCA